MAGKAAVLQEQINGYSLEKTRHHNGVRLCNLPQITLIIHNLQPNIHTLFSFPFHMPPILASLPRDHEREFSLRLLE